MSMRTLLVPLLLSLGWLTSARADTFATFDPALQFDCPSSQASPCVAPPLRVGNDCRVALLINGVSSLQARLAVLKKAKISIRIQALVFSGDESGMFVASRLVEMKKKNPRLIIHVIVDALSNVDPKSQEMYNFLKANGIEFKGDPAQVADDLNAADARILNKRFHDKMWIIDAEDSEAAVAITGGMNIANEYFRMGDDTKHVWRDQDTVEHGAIVTDIAAAFDSNFRYFNELEKTRPEIFKNPTLVKAWNNWVNFYHDKIVSAFKRPNAIMKRIKKLEDAGMRWEGIFAGATCRFVQNRPRFGETYILQTYLDLINNAATEIQIANAYFIPPDELIDALKSAARKGRRVKILTNSYETNDLNQMTYASRALYKTLLAVNDESETQSNGGSLRIFEWQGHNNGEAQTDGTIHAKYMVVDRSALIIGSYNLDPRSQRLNSETVLAIQSGEKGAALANQYDNEDLKRSSEITRAQAEDWNDPQQLTDGINLELSLKFKGQF